MSQTSGRWTAALYPLASIVAVTALAELSSYLGWVAAYILPPPSEVLATLNEDWTELSSAFLQTTRATAIGLLFSVFGGLLLGVLSGLFRWIRLSLVPVAVFFQTVPIIAVAPLLVIWFGYGPPTVVASAFIVSLFPMISATTLGLRSVEPQFIELFRILRASRFQTLVHLLLPFAVPHFLAGLRVAAGLAVIGAIVGEFIAGGGLGEIVDMARTQQRLDKVFAAVVLSAALGFIFVVIIDMLALLLLGKWHPSYQETKQ